MRQNCKQIYHSLHIKLSCNNHTSPTLNHNNIMRFRNHTIHLRSSFCKSWVQSTHRSRYPNWGTEEEFLANIAGQAFETEDPLYASISNLVVQTLHVQDKCKKTIKALIGLYGQTPFPSPPSPRPVVKGITATTEGLEAKMPSLTTNLKGLGSAEKAAKISWKAPIQLLTTSKRNWKRMHIVTQRNIWRSNTGLDKCRKLGESNIPANTQSTPKKQNTGKTGTKTLNSHCLPEKMTRNFLNAAICQTPSIIKSRHL